MSSDRKSVPVSLPEGLVEELDRLVDEGLFSSRSEALRYGARLVTQESIVKRLHELSRSTAKGQLRERLDRKDVRRH
jgi:Arc/MetJ-type ribon-helix-helix transcriptional regulator